MHIPEQAVQQPFFDKSKKVEKRIFIENGTTASHGIGKPVLRPGPGAAALHRIQITVRRLRCESASLFATAAAPLEGTLYMRRLFLHIRNAMPYGRKDTALVFREPVRMAGEIRVPYADG